MRKKLWVVKVKGPNSTQYVDEENNLIDLSETPRKFYTRCLAEEVGKAIVACKGDGYSFSIEYEPDMAEVLPEL